MVAPLLIRLCIATVQKVVIAQRPLTRNTHFCPSSRLLDHLLFQLTFIKHLQLRATSVSMLGRKQWIKSLVNEQGGVACVILHWKRLGHTDQYAILAFLACCESGSHLSEDMANQKWYLESLCPGSCCWWLLLTSSALVSLKLTQRCPRPGDFNAKMFLFYRKLEIQHQSSWDLVGMLLTYNWLPSPCGYWQVFALLYVQKKNKKKG